tara:strand:+ start:98 stop:622 length:525 start_codon:yes stop_codon:yes gene_type:complete
MRKNLLEKDNFVRPIGKKPKGKKVNTRNTEEVSLDFVSEAQKHRCLGGTMFEEAVKYHMWKELNLNILNSKRIGLRETDLTFDVDGIVQGELDTHFFEVKKSISDSTICKIYAQYMAWFYNSMKNQNMHFTFTVITEDSDSKKGKTSMRYLAKLKDLPNFRYTDFDNVKNLDWS